MLLAYRRDPWVHAGAGTMDQGGYEFQIWLGKAKVCAVPPEWMKIMGVLGERVVSPPVTAGHPLRACFAYSRPLTLREGEGSAWWRSSPCPLLKEGGESGWSSLRRGFLAAAAIPSPTLSERGRGRGGDRHRVPNLP